MFYHNILLLNAFQNHFLFVKSKQDKLKQIIVQVTKRPEEFPTRLLQTTENRTSTADTRKVVTSVRHHKET